MKALRAYLGTVFGAVCAAIILAGIYLTNFDFLDFGIKAVLKVESNEIDEFVLAFVLLIVGLTIDLARSRREKKRLSEIDAQRLRVLKATMRTVNDIVNNFLNNMQLFRFRAADGVLTEDSLVLFDSLIQETAARLKALGDLQSTPEMKMANGIGIEIPYAA